MPTYFSYPNSEDKEELEQISEAIPVPGRGILTVDEINEYIGKLLNDLGLENTEDDIRKYRQLFFPVSNISRTPTYFTYLSSEIQKELEQIAQGIVVPGRGILAVDEIIEYIGNLLNGRRLENTANNRRKYLQSLLTSNNADGLASFGKYDGETISEAD